MSLQFSQFTSVGNLTDTDELVGLDASNSNLSTKNSRFTGATIYTYLKGKIGVDRTDFFEASPGNGQYYGTDGAGVFGYHPIAGSIDLQGAYDATAAGEILTDATRGALKIDGTLSPNSALQLSNGTESAPALANITSPSSGIYFDQGVGIERVSISIDGTESARFWRDTVTNVSRFAIGQGFDPTHALDVRTNGLTAKFANLSGITLFEVQQDGDVFFRDFAYRSSFSSLLLGSSGNRLTLAFTEGDTPSASTANSVRFTSADASVSINGLVKVQRDSHVSDNSKALSFRGTWAPVVATNVYDTLSFDEDLDLSNLTSGTATMINIAPILTGSEQNLNAINIASGISRLRETFITGAIRQSVGDGNSIFVTNAGVKPDLVVGITIDSSVAIGQGILRDATATTIFRESVATGRRALVAATGTIDQTSVYGKDAAANLTGSAVNALALGWFSQVGTDNVDGTISIGSLAGNDLTENTKNILIGVYAGADSGGGGITTGDYNLVVGSHDSAAISVKTSSPTASNEMNIANVLYGVNLYSVSNAGRIGINTNAPTSALDINSDSIRLRTAKTPATASDTGTQGQIAWDADYIYVCTATDTWKRVAIATW